MKKATLFPVGRSNCTIVGFGPPTARNLEEDLRTAVQLRSP